MATQSEQFEFPPAHSEYHKFRKDRNLVLKKYLEAPNRFQQIGERKDKSDTSGAAFRASFDGKYFTFYRGFDLMKGCHDMVIYTQLFWYVKPATVIEIGAYSGGRAVWMADMLKLMNLECSVYSMDIDLSLIDNRVKKLQPDNVKFVHGDCHKTEEAFTPEFLHTMPHPLVIIEDAHENFPNTLEYFHNYMKPRDYFIVDNTNPHTYTTSGMAKVYPDYKEWGPGKLNQLRRFLTKHNQYYAVDSFFTDFFGYNGTCNWNVLEEVIPAIFAGPFFELVLFTKLQSKGFDNFVTRFSTVDMVSVNLYYTTMGCLTNSSLFECSCLL